MRVDLLITDARVMDGTGNPFFYADVAVAGERIVAVTAPGHFPRENATQVLCASGKVLCPGFIDIQSHSLHPYLTEGRGLSKVTQGVTTEILGELWTPAPFGGRRTERQSDTQTWRHFSDWLKHYEARGVSVNVGSFVGGGSVREWACGWDAAVPSDDQLEQMRRVTAEAMEEGAFGIAPALIYPPDSYSTDHQLTECARVVGRYGGLYIVHLRSEGDGLLESIEATAQLSELSGCPVEIYHLKASGERNWDKMPRAIERISELREQGIDITADMYPYVASGTGLSVLIPTWAHEGGRLYENLADPAMRRRIHAEMSAPQAATGDFASSDRGGHVMPLGFLQDENRRFIGLRLTQIAEQLGCDWANATIDLLLSENQRIGTVFFSMCEENLRLQLQQPWIKISTDAGGLDPATQATPVHPRAYGTYTRVLGKYVRDECLLTWEDAIRKMTSAVAERLRLRDRGQIRENFFADLVIFDPATISDRATFTDPHQLSIGIEWVFVNGKAVVQNGAHTGALPGKALLRGG
ncbi:amidohydrolase family protein [Armatimonas sp.]|uniref:N-acyl-D-amino-acid deacylase family protein n=1 Tax=Armatimonas sp. TaxID=1872638 RepID=UPI003753D5B3